MSSAEIATSAARAIKGVVTEIVRALGGDEQCGGQHLAPKRTLMLCGHKHAFRFPVGSRAAHMPTAELTDQIEKEYAPVHISSAIGNHI